MKHFFVFGGLLLVCSAVIAEDSPFITKAEFDAFVQQYQAQQSTGQPRPKGLQKGQFTITPYGYINLDISYDTEKTVNGDYTVWAQSREAETDPGFNLDPKSSRIGVKINRQDYDWKSEGCFEVDFQNSPYKSRNRAAVMLRKAYVSVTNGSTMLLAGQDWEVISPLYPKMLDYPMASCLGNLGYRRGMLRVDKKIGCGSNSHLVLQFALTDTVYLGDSTLNPSTPRYPTMQGRIGYSFPHNVIRKPVTVGVSGHIGEQRYDFIGTENNGAERKYLKTWSCNIDFDCPLSKQWTFQIEYYFGENLANCDGSVYEGVDNFLRRTVYAHGGWAAVTYQHDKKLQFNTGFLVDDPLNDTLVTGPKAAGTVITYNHAIFTNVMYNWTDALMTGIEFSVYRTNYQMGYADGTVRPMRNGSPERIQFTTRYTF